MIKVSIDLVIDHLEAKNLLFQYEGPFDLVFDSIRSLTNFSQKSISFYRGNDPSVINDFKLADRLLIIKLSMYTYCSKQSNILAVENPDLAICYIGQLFEAKSPIGVHPTAVIHLDAMIYEPCSIAANVVIGEDVVIGPDVRIEEGAVIKHCTIGANTHIFPGVKIGSSGLGSHRDETGEWHHFPHTGSVVIGSNVTIQDNCIIARGSLNQTIIEDGVVIGPLSCIAHGAHIKKNAFISQSVTVAGSVVIEEGSIVWGNASIRDGLKIGAHSTIGMGAVVVKNVIAGSTVFGNPAKPR